MLIPRRVKHRKQHHPDRGPRTEGAVEPGQNASPAVDAVPAGTDPAAVASPTNQEG